MLHVRNRWVHRFSLERLGSLDILSNSGKQQSQFSQNGFSFCILHCIWQAVRIQMKCRIRCGISLGWTLSAKTKMRSTFILPLVFFFFLAVIISGKQGIRTLSAALYSTRPRHRVGSVPSVKHLDFPRSALSEKRNTRQIRGKYVRHTYKIYLTYWLMIIRSIYLD